jgi:hypothetical protein
MAAPYHVDACQPTSTISILTPNARTCDDENGGGRHRRLRSSGQSARRELLGPQGRPLTVNSFTAAQGSGTAPGDPTTLGLPSSDL